MLTGHIDQIGQCLYVKYSTTLFSEPTLKMSWWKIERVTQNPFSVGSPTVGDEVTSQSSGSGWVGSGYTVYCGSNDAEKVEFAPFPCPPARGKPTRWHDGRWEKRMARGWVPA